MPSGFETHGARNQAVRPVHSLHLQLEWQTLLLLIHKRSSLLSQAIEELKKTRLSLQSWQQAFILVFS